MSYYFLNQSRETQGPVSETALRELKDSGALGDDPQIWVDGSEKWVSFESVFGPESSDAGISEPPPLPVRTSKAEPAPVAAESSAPASGKSNNKVVVVLAVGGTIVFGLFAVGFFLSMIFGGGGGDYSSNRSSGNGAGEITPTTMTCFRCRGSGAQAVSCTYCRGTRVFTTQQGVRMTCPHCQGLGAKRIPCGGCGGRGVTKYSKENLYAPRNRDFNPNLGPDFQ